MPGSNNSRRLPGRVGLSLWLVILGLGVAQLLTAQTPRPKFITACPVITVSPASIPAKTNDSVMLVALLGSGGDALVNSGDAVADKQRAEKFASDYADKHSVTMEGDSKATLLVGKDDWPMPIPRRDGIPARSSARPVPAAHPSRRRAAARHPHGSRCGALR